MKLFNLGLLLICTAVNAAVTYQTPSVDFKEYTYGKSETEKEQVLQKCIKEIATEKIKLLKAGLVILSESCERRDKAPGESGESDHVLGSMNFIR